MRKTSILMLLALIHGLTAIAFAQEKYSYEVGPYISYAGWQDRHFDIAATATSPATSVRMRLDARPIYGVRVNLLSRKHWGGELAYAYELNRVTLTRPNFKTLALDGGVHHFFYNEVFYPVRYERSPVLPFFTGGIGVAAYHLGDDARAKVADPKLSSMDARFAFNYGAGIKVNASSHFGIRADFRHNFSDVPNFGIRKELSSPNQIALPTHGKLQMYEGSVGIYYHITE